MTWGSLAEIERRNRIMASVYAYAYEIMDDTLVPDLEYDALCRKINPEMPTGNDLMDHFFKTEFHSDTGVWIHRHPEPRKIESLYQRMTGKSASRIPSYKNTEPPVTKHVSNMGFKSNTDMKIYMASLGFRVLGHSLMGEPYGRLDFEFDTDYFHVTQPQTGIRKSISYREYFKQSDLRETGK